jgi:hypothetical protein
MLLPCGSKSTRLRYPYGKQCSRNKFGRIRALSVSLLVMLTMQSRYLSKTKNRVMFKIVIYVQMAVPDPVHKQFCGSEIFLPDPGSHFSHPGSRIQGQKDPVSESASKDLSIFNPKNSSSEKLSGMFIPDPGSGSATLSIRIKG